MPKTKKEVDFALRTLFRIKRRDIPPWTGWKKPSSREDIYKVMNEMGCFKKGAEIGVALGKNAKTMLSTIEGLDLTCVDPWIPYSNWRSEQMEYRYKQTLKRLDPFIKNGQAHVLRKTSMDAVKDVAPESLDFVYIDGFHDFDWVMADIIFWVYKVRQHGIIAGHDYYPFYRSGVMTAVDAYVKGHNINDWYVTREQEPSWFWVKP